MFDLTYERVTDRGTKRVLCINPGPDPIFLIAEILNMEMNLNGRRIGRNNISGYAKTPDWP